MSEVAALVTKLGKLPKTDRDARLTVIGALVKSGDPAALEPLCDLLAADNLTEVIHSAIGALRSLGDPRAISRLVDMNDHVLRYTDVREDFASTLRKLARCDPPAIHPALQQKSARIREIAAKILADIGDHRSVVPILLALDRLEPEIAAAKDVQLWAIGTGSGLSYETAALYQLLDAQSALKHAVRELETKSPDEFAVERARYAAHPAHRAHLEQIQRERDAKENARRKTEAEQRERLRRSSVMKERAAVGLCSLCGHPLRFFDRLQNRTHHRACTAFRD